MEGHERTKRHWTGGMRHSWTLDHVSTPLAPRAVFPMLGQRQTAFMFTDAARETGTGFGGFTLWRRKDKLEFRYLAEQWGAEMLRDLQANVVSMPAGEAIRAVILADLIIQDAPFVQYF